MIGKLSGEHSLAELVPITRSLLPAMVDESGTLLVHKVTFEEGHLQKRGTSPLYTAIGLVGLLADGDGAGSGSPGSDSRVFDAILRSVERTRDAFLLGAVIWALAMRGDGRARELAVSADRRVRPREQATMGLGLLLSGLASVAAAFPDSRRHIGGFADRCALELGSRFSSSARLFRSSAQDLSRSHAQYSRVTSYANQVYPLHGLAARAISFDAAIPPLMAQVADALLEAQGPQGQWWWLYSSKTGAVLEGYPVYSVHQDAMAFMALAPLQQLGVGNYERALSLGLRWLFGENELGVSLVAHDPPAIFRCIQRAGSNPDGVWGVSGWNRARVAVASRGLAAPPSTDADVSALEVLHECRPYHLGWLLYAHSLNQGRIGDLS